jgi:hypothetical protein
LNVHNVPLDEVLNIVGLQTDSRWTRLYPIYSTSKSLDAFKQVLLGDRLPAESGWSGLQQLGAWQQAGLGGFANTLRAENKLVSAQLINKDLPFTALALSRFSKAQVVPEDGIKRTVILRLQQVPFDKAVARVACEVRLKWNRLYTLQPLNGATMVRQTKRVPAGTNSVAAGATPAVISGLVPVQTNQVAIAQTNEAMPPEVALEAITSTMTPEEKQQMMAQFGGANQAPGAGSPNGQPAMPALSPEAAAQAAQAAREDLQSRIDNRLKDGTVDQRLAHDRRVLAQQQAAQKQ